MENEKVVMEREESVRSLLWFSLINESVTCSMMKYNLVSTCLLLPCAIGFLARLIAYLFVIKFQLQRIFHFTV